MTQRAISLPFSFDETGAVAYSTDDKKIWQDRIVLIVMTSLNERVMRPSFGTNVKKMVFENRQSIGGLIKQEITSAFSSWLPSLTLTNVNATMDDTGEFTIIEIEYKYGLSATTETMSIKTGIFSRSGDVILEVTNG